MNLWLLAFLVACFVDTLAPAVHAQGTISNHAYLPSPDFPSPHPSFCALLICPSPLPEASSELSSTTKFSD